MRAHQDFVTVGGNVDTKQQEYLRREIIWVPQLWDDAYASFIRDFLFKQVDPATQFKDFRVDMDYSDWIATTKLKTLYSARTSDFFTSDADDCCQ